MALLCPGLPALPPCALCAVSTDFVRNYGSVPNLHWTSHRLSVSGVDGDRQRTFDMAGLSQLPQHTIAVTIACAANRRKELNSVRHTSGCSWGAGAVATARWTGVRLVDLLQQLRIDSTYQSGISPLHLCFEAADAPYGGPYGTSIDFAYAVDPLNSLLLALRQNDEPLPPDQGFPLRLIAPGMVDGRQVKWLSRIWVSRSASPSWYHQHHNKMLPSSVTTEAATSSWWPRTPPLYDMCVQAVITQPTHQQWMDTTKLPDPGDGREGKKGQQLRIRGFAHSGGGRRIIRVEVSLDAQSWQPCQLQFLDGGLDAMGGAEGSNAKHWTWVFWSLLVPVHRLFHARDIRCRAMDSSFNCTAEEPTWNYLGALSHSPPATPSSSPPLSPLPRWLICLFSCPCTSMLSPLLLLCAGVCV